MLNQVQHDGGFGYGARMKPAPKTFHVKSFGCQMNVYDGERMAELMAAEGMTAADAAHADLVVLNTCHIRERATEKVYSDIGRLRKREDGPAPMIAVAGCVAQAEGEEIARRAQVSMSWSVRRPITTCPSWWRRRRAAGSRSIPTCRSQASSARCPPAGRSARRRSSRSRKGATSSAPIAWCPIPAAPRSAGRAQAIVDEAKALVDAGAREITLLGQNVNAWDEDGRGLDGLIRALDRIPGLARIRYTTSHPNDMTQGLIDAHRDVEKLMPFLHLPVQSGSDRILKAMNRSHSRDSYLRILERSPRRRPDIALSGDFIVGFPGETDAEFEETLSLVGEVGLRPGLQLQILSPPRHSRGGDGRIRSPAEVMDERLQRLQVRNQPRPDRIQPSNGRARLHDPARTRRQAPRPADRQDAVAAIGASHDRGRDRRNGRGRGSERRTEFARRGGTLASHRGCLAGGAPCVKRPSQTYWT